MIAEFGRHAPYIIGSYAVVALVVAGLIAWVLIDGRRLAREIERLEAQGVRRRSARGRDETAGDGAPRG